MCGKQMLKYAFYIAVISVILSITEAEVINCSPRPFPVKDPNGQTVLLKNVTLYFNVNRDSVGVYLYPETPSVNLFIHDSAIYFSGDIEKDDGTVHNLKNVLTAEVLGIANVADVRNATKGLKDCSFFVADKKTGSFYNELPTQLAAIIFQTVERCADIRLCSQLGGVREDDIVRARKDSRDFGPMSIWSRTLQENFPKMKPPRLAENNNPKKKANLVQAADSIVRNVAELFQYNTNGTIEIPDLQSGVSSASEGTFEGLNTLLLDTRVQIQASPPGKPIQTFSFSFGIPKGHVIYNNFKAVRLMPVRGSLCADVQDMIFTATVQMDFSKKYCRPNLQDFRTEHRGESNSYTCGRLSFITNPVMQWFVNAWNNEIAEVVENRIEWAMAAYIYDKFDCENFRTVKFN